MITYDGEPVGLVIHKDDIYFSHFDYQFIINLKCKFSDFDFEFDERNLNLDYEMEIPDFFECEAFVEEIDEYYKKSVSGIPTESYVSMINSRMMKVELRLNVNFEDI